MSVSGATLAISGAGSISGTLAVSGVSNSGALTQTGSSTFSGAVSVTGASFSCAGATSVNLGSNPISLSGAGITTNTIPATSVVGTAVTLGASQTKTAGTLTFATGSAITMNSGSTLTINGTVSTTNAITGACSQLQATDSSGTATTCYFPFMELGSYTLNSSPSSQTFYSDANLNYVPSTKTLTCPNFSGTVSYCTSAGNLILQSAGAVTNMYIPLGNNQTGQTALGTSPYFFYNNTSNGQLNVPALLVGGYSKQSTVGQTGDTISIGGSIYLNSSPNLPVTNTISTITQLGYTSNNSFTIASTGYTNFLVAGATSTVLSTSSQFGIYQLIYNFSFSGMSSSNTFGISIGSATASTHNVGCYTVINNAMQNGSGLAGGQLTYVLSFFAVSNCYVVVNSAASVTVTNSRVTLLRIG